MKKITAAALALGVGFGAATASAADLAPATYTKAPPLPVAAVYDWTGFYVGGNAGGGAGHSNTDAELLALSRFIAPTGVLALGSTTVSPVGGLGGLQAGYNWQMNSFVFGLEADIQATSQRGDGVVAATVLVPSVCIAPCVPGPPTPIGGALDYTQKLPWFGTARARVGFTPVDRWLVYATGGLAYGEVRTDASITVPLVGTSTGSFNETRTGWVVGAGVEAALSGSWTVKFEYLHVDLGNVTTNLLSTNGGGAFAGTIVGTSRVTDDIMRVGLNYRWGGPVVARY